MSLVQPTQRRVQSGIGWTAIKIAELENVIDAQAAQIKALLKVIETMRIERLPKKRRG